jgi:SAM-dependent methyltransferase
VVAIDGSESMLDYAKTRNSHPNIQYVLLDIEGLKLKQKFDLILVINSLVHIKTLGPIFVKIHKLLKKDGKFILCFPHPLQDIENINNYSKEKIIRTETKYGVVKQYYRPIEFYINKLLQSNFRITKVYEFPARKPDFFIVESQ